MLLLKLLMWSPRLAYLETWYVLFCHLVEYEFDSAFFKFDILCDVFKLTLFLP